MLLNVDRRGERHREGKRTKVAAAERRRMHQPNEREAIARAVGKRRKHCSEEVFRGECRLRREKSEGEGVIRSARLNSMHVG